MALRAANGLLDGVTALLVLLAVVWSGYALWDNSRVYAAADNVQAGLLAFKPRPQEDNSLSFGQLRDINPDVCGWLTLDGTAIDYPVVQGESNFTYLNTDVYGSFALAGSIFLDVDCDADFSGRYSLLYGHHMENGRMFGDLDKYKDGAFFRQNTTGTLTLPGGSYRLEVLHYLDPVGYEEINKMLSERAGDEFLASVSGVIKSRLEESGIEGATIKRRVKSIYGIYRKTIMQNKSFDEIYDIYAVRIILDTLAECYSTLGLIHDMYHPLPNRFKDYISTPKPNGYQSLHTTVIGHEGIPFEVQIRTRTMDEQAEYGVAAHWKYKEGLEGHDKLDERLAWVSQLLENQRVSEDSGNLLHDLKSDLLPEEVFAFTPKGDVINLPAGANCIDFAYAIHSAVGNRMVGCKVNNRIVPIDHVVATGEIIEVILGPADKGPSRDWLKIVRTSEAKSKIRNWFKKMRREENIQQGRDALAKELRREMIFIPDDQLDEFVGSCSRRLRQNNAEEIYAAIGYGGMTIANCLPKLKEEWQKLKAAEAAENKSVEDLPKVDLSRVHATDGVVVEGFDNTPIKFAKCCSPLPGDPIVGFITRGFGVSIHKQSCANAMSSMKDPSNAPRWVKAYWADSVKDSYKAGLEIIALNRNELLSDVLAALADIRVPIYAMNARQVENNCAVISLTIGINNTEHLNRVVARLSKVKDVLKVTRQATRRSTINPSAISILSPSTASAGWTLSRICRSGRTTPVQPISTARS